MTFSLSPGAGIYKTARDTPTKLIGIAGNVTFGSFTSTYNEGNRKLSAEKTEIFDPETMTSINAKGLPNEGLEDFLLDEWDTIWAQLHNSGTLARISVSPRTSGELASMSRFIVNGQWHEKIDELEINLSCPNHRSEDGLHPVLARDPQAINDALKEVSGYSGKKAIKIAPDTDEYTLNQIVDLCVAHRISTIVSSNTRLQPGKLAGKKLGVETGGVGGSPLLEAGRKQVIILRRLIRNVSTDIKLVACGGITSVSSAMTYCNDGADEGQMTTVPYFLGEKAAYNVMAGVAAQL